MTPPPSPPAHSYLSFLPIVMSAIAIFVSLATAALTAYLQYFRKPKLELLVSHWLRTWFGVNNKLVLNMGITISNFGARYAVVTRISGLLISISQRESTELEWSKFITYENAAPAGEQFKPHGSFAGWADYLLIPNRQAIANNIQFFTKKAFVGRPGKYRLRLTAHAGSGVKEEVVATAEVEFQISEAQAEKLSSARVDPETKIAKSSVSFATTHV